MARKAIGISKGESRKRVARGEVQLDGAIEPRCRCCIACEGSEGECGKVLLSSGGIYLFADEVQYIEGQSNRGGECSHDGDLGYTLGFGHSGNK